jgi:signal transduction histidine kinase/DNA-binding response OmpR family regulator
VATSASAHFQATILFSAIYCLIPLTSHATYPIYEVAMNVAAFLLAGYASGRVAEHLQNEKESFRRTSDAYQGLTNALNLNIMNLQAKMDSLSEAHKSIQEIERNKTRFISGVSHEIRAPLSSIRSFSEILLNYGDIEPDTLREFLTIINKESERLTLLANEILDVVRLESGKTEWHMDSVDLNSVVHTSVRTIGPLVQDKALEIAVDAKEPGPSVRGDSNRLLQVFLNLLSNAVKFTSKGKITVGIEDTPGEVKCFVSDTGEGIYPEESEKIFEEFYRIGDYLEGRPRGSGLGLSICKNIVEAHGGRIWAESELGKGSTFYFVLPKVAELPEREVEKIAPLPEISGRHVLVLDDYRPIRQVLRGALEGIGYKTLGAENVGMALEMSKVRKPNAIVLCHPSSEENFEELRTFSRLNGLPLCLAGVIKDEEIGPQVAVNGFISKPYNVEQVDRLLGEVWFAGSRRVLIISEDQEEARNIQAIVGSRGYGTDVVHAAAAVTMSRLPGVIVVGALPKEEVYKTVSFLRGNHTTRNIPILLTLNIMIRDIECIGLGSTSYGSGLLKLVEYLEGEARA